ncbi:hypothetical protein A4G18_02780 [Pasteurellaceae bacterium Pebbles2]|nr:hypothetical protein [Pasteurellaceae bacterium Pebbles2]
MSEQVEQKSWFRKALDKYDRFCDELGVNKGACRGCVPVVKFDPEATEAEKKSTEAEQKT